METGDTKILKILFKEFSAKHTVTSIAKELEMTRIGAWKALKRMEKQKLVVLIRIGAGKTSTYIISLNWENQVLEKTLSLALTEEAVKSQRWADNFKELENKVRFFMLYGSILNSKDANDIDVLVVAKNNKFPEIDSDIVRIQKTQIKKIHALNFTEEEFKQELKKPNKVFIDAIKKGIILFGQENFIKFMRGMQHD